MTGSKILGARQGAEASTLPNMPRSERLHYLDALRSFCMLFGLFVHATTLDTFGWLDAIPFISGQFRMATFFAASAMLSALVLQRRSVGPFVIKRLILLIVPFTAGVVLINPVTLWLIWQVHESEPENLRNIIFLSISSDGPWKPQNLVWHLHLWFLVTLAVYAALTPALNRIIGSVRVSQAFDKFLQRIPAALRVLTIALIAAAVATLLRIAGEIMFPLLYEWWLTRATLLNVTFFITGILIAHSVPLRAVGFDPVSVITALLLIILLKIEVITPDSVIGKLVGLCSNQIVNVSAIFFLMWVFRRFANSPSRMVDLVIRTIYTVYIFHYLFIYIVGALFINSDINKYIVYLTAVLASFLGGLVTHKIVSGTPVLSWLFNGKVAPLRNNE